MNKRTIKIINELIKSGRKTTIQNLADQFEVSQRTIRNDLAVINELLEGNGMQRLELERGGLIQCPDNFFEIRQWISVEDYYSYKLSKEERVMIAAAFMINSVGYITLSTIAENLFVSRATVINDLNDIKKLISDSNLEVISQPNKGLMVRGRESDKRWFLFSLSAFNLDGVGKIQKNSSMVNVNAGSRITIQKIINELEIRYDCRLIDSSFLKLQKYLGIMINRNMEGEYIEEQVRRVNSYYPLAQDIIRLLSQYFQFSTTEDEVYYLADFLEQCKYRVENVFDSNVVRIQMLTRQFIREVSEELALNLNNDYDFFENLSNHMKGMYATSESNYPDTDIVREIAEDNPEIQEAVISNLHIFRQFDPREITEIEIIYITVHVCAAVERKKNRDVSFHVIVACHAGIGTSQLLMEKLKKHFNFQIVDIISSHEASTLEPDKADLIISTVPLKECPIDYVVVNPLLSDEDYIRVGNKIDILRNNRNLPARSGEKEISVKGIMERVESVLLKYVPEKADALTKVIRKEIRQYFRQMHAMEDSILTPYLHQLLPVSHIQIDVECADWRDAVRKSAEPLVTMGYIEERYIPAMISNIEENGPYIVLSPGFAVPHEGLDAGSIKVGMNLIRLKHPVAFGAEDFDPVEFVCCLSAIDYKAHMKAFFNLVNILTDEEFHTAMHEAGSAQEIADIITNFEYGLEK